VPFNNGSREKAITISGTHWRSRATQLSVRWSKQRLRTRLQVACPSQGEGEGEDSLSDFLGDDANPLARCSPPFAAGEAKKDHEVFGERAADSSMLIAFLGFSIDRDFMGQQHRVRAKRKRRLAYLRRKKAALQSAAARPAPTKQQTQKESAAAE
jgi:hypothetical protein